MDRLVSPKITKEIVNKHGFKFSKSLGQNFLIDENILYKIVDGAEVDKEDIVIEVGPGIGTLTQVLAERAKKVIAIEIDKTLLPILSETLGNKDNVEVINEDVLKLDIHKLIEEKCEGKAVKVIANLPYYVTTPIIMKFLEEKVPLKNMVVMIQKEVADRMQAKPKTKDYGSLSIAVQYYCDPEIITKVPRSVFIPQPKVESTVIRLTVLKEPKVNVKNEKTLFAVVRAAFGKRRKTLLNALSNSPLNVDKEVLKKVLEHSEIEANRRGETLTIEEFARISETLCKYL
ncbi:16S rRNA (adenine(1518)-N(6)/adenine(1519)-N(6))-dimethyltransferase RsmA [Crassaminicella profunda]|uniref:16S rRNA (adenine(1518)-N(6)/adenine(1519)-N(6))- dimethyltransferase RsmA n=1 Tax=Crassaminicella profunda TaxID=1286698 RepID=UPI001CA7583A|nr:16S rRNA (adenine(1518)-N(6)/adenine(1519)-N(6))-dimethyltransferase RsmA [Crassaminicella profunda]QZY55355.1 16S rRNA (adenine(1518)-N(6)/adenine(1519)-N(6))-dimethyltransferase RsmA [Crassaminicella profunda]